MIKYKNVLLFTFVSLIIIIVICTIVGIESDKKEKTYENVVKEIIDAADKCTIDKKCVNDKILLKDLYDKNYIETKVVNPKTKKLFNEKSYVLHSEGSFYIKK